MRKPLHVVLDDMERDFPGIRYFNGCWSHTFQFGSGQLKLSSGFVQVSDSTVRGFRRKYAALLRLRTRLEEQSE